VSEPKDKFTPELRLIAAALLSFVVLILWTKYFGPKPPTTPPQDNRPAQTAPAKPGPSSPAQNTTPSNAAATPGTAAAIAAAASVNIAAKADSQERTIVIENDLYRAEISNRGAVVKSWQLKKYMDDSKPQKILDLVHPQSAEQTGGWPFSLEMEDAQLEAAANAGLYQISTSASVLNAPADAEFTWSDGHLEVSKHFHFDHSYVVRVETSVTHNGAPVTAGLAWRGGFGDLTVKDPVPLETVSTFYSQAGKLSNFGHKKLDGPEKLGNGIWQGGKDFTGIEDRYFTAVFLPANGATPGALETRYWKVFPPDKKDESEAVPEVATTTLAHPSALRVYIGPKDYDDLKKMDPPLHSLVQFGWMEFVADPLFHAMKWVRTAIPNWGWTIIVLTLLINMLFFPLRISGYKSTVKMQRVAPEIKAIQERYKKYKMNDPRKAEMNKEVMAVYSREGINIGAGCLPMLLQMPIWFGLNTALRGAIELRHANWLWIKDLASKDPYYILPVTVGVSMYLVSKMTPMTATDPQQAQMMKLMPISMAVMFMFFPLSSGLALYILTSSLVGIVQQWYLNRTHPVVAPAKPNRSKN
jgi:YidC/Oxa1 family membrane protein insertase